MIRELIEQTEKMKSSISLAAESLALNWVSFWKRKDQAWQMDDLFRVCCGHSPSQGRPPCFTETAENSICCMCFHYCPQGLMPAFLFLVGISGTARKVKLLVSYFDLCLKMNRNKKIED